MEHSVTLLLLVALSFGLLLFTVGSGKPGKAASDSTEDNPSSHFSLDNHRTSRSF